MKIRTDFVTNSSSSSFILFTNAIYNVEDVVFNDKGTYIFEIDDDARGYFFEPLTKIFYEICTKMNVDEIEYFFGENSEL